MKELTKRQNETLTEIKAFIKLNGYSPSMSEIADSIGVTVNAARESVAALERKGAITQVPKQTRTIRPAKGFKEAWK